VSCWSLINPPEILPIDCRRAVAEASAAAGWLADGSLTSSGVTAHDVMEAVATAIGVDVASAARLGGGDVAESYRLDLADGRTVFAKTHRSPPPGFFSTEAAGLAWLREPGAVAVPAVLAASDGDADGPPVLVLEWIDEDHQRRPRPDDEAQFGRALAELHRAGAPSFGRQDRRTTGSRALPNDPCDTWVEFYATRRLLPLDRLARRSSVLSDAAHADLGRVVERLADLGGPPEPPARLHGDLWAGNRLVDRARRSWLIDPAAHGGHREFDLAMMRLFGGFGDECFAAYDAAYPLADGWPDRVALHQLAPLLVHSIKFGSSYVPATERALARVLRRV
jgi:fructosamine-3-kinase